MDSAAWTTLVVPCYNEEERLDTESFLSFLSAHPHLRFHFVNDGSQDGTLAVLRTLQAGDPSRIGVLDLPANAGKAEAVRQGLIAAAGDGSTYMGYWDADLATPLNELPKVLAPLLEKSEVQGVLASRVRLLGSDVHRQAARHYAGRLFATAASWVLGLPVYDTQCGAKVFRVSPTFVSVLQHPFQTRWIFDVELIARLAQALRRDGMQADAALVEVPLSVWTDVPGSKLRLRDGLHAGMDLLRVRRLYPPTIGQSSVSTSLPS